METTEADTITPEDIEEDESTPTGFAERRLGLLLYLWQENALEPLDDLIDPPGSPTNPLDRPVAKRTTICVRAPNGSGKSERIVAAAILYWLSIHPKARVVFTTKDSKQLAVQVWPALLAHRHRFPTSWHWVTAPHHRITTPTGGSALLFTTTDEGRAEGFHMDFDPFAGHFDGPLLVIVDEAKSVADRIFNGISRCTFNVLMMISSPGFKVGRFYDAMTRNKERNVCVVAGLADCPHIPRSKIEGMIADAPLGVDDPVIRSSLFGEWMEGSMRGRFDREGIKHIRALALTHLARRRLARVDPQPGGNGKAVAFVPCLNNDPSAWLYVWEELIPGCRYLVVVDTASFKEQQNSENDGRDCHAVLVLRDSYTDAQGQIQRPAVVARIIPPCRWSLEVISERVAWLSRWIGDGLVCVEANNTGIALIVMLKAFGVPLYHRVTGTPENPVRKPGFHTSSDTKYEIISKLAQAIRYRPANEAEQDQGKDQEIDVWDEHIADELSWFVQLPDGSEGAEPGLHDDDVMALAIGLHRLRSGTVHRPVQEAYRPMGRKAAGATS